MCGLRVCPNLGRFGLTYPRLFKNLPSKSQSPYSPACMCIAFLAVSIAEHCCLDVRRGAFLFQSTYIASTIYQIIQQIHNETNIVESLEVERGVRRSTICDGDAGRADEGGGGAGRGEGCGRGVQVKFLERNRLIMFGNEKIKPNVRNIGPWDSTVRGLMSVSKHRASLLESCAEY